MQNTYVFKAGCKHMEECRPPDSAEPSGFHSSSIGEPLRARAVLAGLPGPGKGCSAQYFPGTGIWGSRHSIITTCLSDPRGVFVLSERNSQPGKGLVF